jgi:hypothetical protein
MLIPDPNFSIPDPGPKRFRIQGPDKRQRVEVFLTQKNVSIIPDPEFSLPGSGSRIQGSKKHRIPDPQHL